MQKMSTTKGRRLSLKSPRAFTQKAAAFFQRAGGLFCNGLQSSIDTPSKVTLALACNALPALSAAAYNPPKAGDHGSEDEFFNALPFWWNGFGTESRKFIMIFDGLHLIKKHNLLVHSRKRQTLVPNLD
jgi:hypothetical protein